MSRNLLCSLVLGSLTGVLLGSCDSLPKSSPGDLPAGLPVAKEKLPPGKVAWQRDVLTGAPASLSINRSWLCQGWVFLETSEHSLLGLDMADGASCMSVRVAGPLLYPPVCDGKKVVFTTLKRLYVVLTRTGRILVDRHLDFLPSGSPCLVGESIYLPTLDRNRIISFSAVDGHRGWSWENGQAPAAGPIACRGGKRDVLVLAMETGNFYGLRANSFDRARPRSHQWETLGICPAGGEILVKGNTAYLASSDTRAYMLDGTSGSVLWSYAAGVPLQGIPAVGNESVLVNTSNGLLCLDHIDGQSKWEFAGKVAVTTFRKGQVFVAANHRLVALDMATGKATGSWNPGDYNWLRNNDDGHIVGWTKGGKVINLRP